MAKLVKVCLWVFTIFTLMFFFKPGTAKAMQYKDGQNTKPTGKPFRVTYLNTKNSLNIENSLNTESSLNKVSVYTEHNNFSDAVEYARSLKQKMAVVSHSSEEYPSGTILWENTAPKGEAYISGVPFIYQNPELPRGCEVTSLAMLINYNGVFADKMVLAEEVRKAPNKYDDPNNGFIGDMYSLTTHGLGVYHKPIVELAQKYIPKRIVDITGGELTDIYYYLDRGQPVWVINNSMFNTLPDYEFDTWDTPSGSVRVTYREHSVLVIGYDDNYIYFHDPLAAADRSVAISSFEKGWIQMGRQAVSVLPEE